MKLNDDGGDGCESQEQEHDHYGPKLKAREEEEGRTFSQNLQVVMAAAASMAPRLLPELLSIGVIKF